VPNTSLEAVLEATGWTDVLKVAVDGAVVYEDAVGVANDLVPALDVVRELYLHPREPWSVSIGRERGIWEDVSRVEVTAFGVMWHKSARHRGLAPQPGETDRAHHARIVAWLEDGGLVQAREELGAQLLNDIAAATRCGLPFDEGSASGPWLLLLGFDPEDRFGPLHTQYSGVDGAHANRVVRDWVLHTEEPLLIDVQVDHLGEPVSLERFRDLLVMLQTPLSRLSYESDGRLEDSE
jgi:hypothetical protein